MRWTLGATAQCRHRLDMMMTILEQEVESEEGRDTYREGGSSGVAGGRGGHVLAWQAAEQVPRVSGRGRSGRRRGEGAGGAGEAGEAEEGGDGQHDTVVEEMHVHNRERSKCVDCRDAFICESSRRSSCKDCGVASICEHNRERSKCADCGDVSICEHDRRRSICKGLRGRLQVVISGGVCFTITK